MPTVALADDHRLFLDALADVLAQRGFQVVGTATTLAGIGNCVGSTRPEVCLLDRHLTDGDALDMLAELRVASPATKFLVLSADPDSAGMARALRDGAAGYLHKASGIDALIAAIGQVLGGDVVVKLPSQARQHAHPTAVDPRQLARYLTAREYECLALLVEGLGTAAMVERLGVTRTTVRTHVQSLLTKLGAHSRLEVASIAVRHRLLEENRTTGQLRRVGA